MRLSKVKGLTLGGGGARGGAHIGALRVLVEYGYKPDLVVGTSIGGITAALVGAGWSADHMEQYISKLDMSDIIRVGRNGNALLSTTGIEELFSEIFGNADLRDLNPRVAVVAADLNSGARVIIDEGPVVKALLATTALPGVFPSVQWSDMELVDGGVVSNTPVQATYQLGADTVIAVDLEGEFDSELAMHDVSVVSQQLNRAMYWLLSLSKRQEALNTLIKAGTLSYDLLTEYEMTAFPPDVLLRVNVSQIGLMELTRAVDVVKLGETVTREKQDEIKKLVSAKWRLPVRRSHNHLPRALLQVSELIQ